MRYFKYPTKIGMIGIAEQDGALVRVRFETETGRDDFPGMLSGSGTVRFEETPLLAEAARQLALYMDGRLREFTVPLSPRGTPFRMSVWKALLAIPYGTTASYHEIACAIGNPKATRAVGMANNKNPLPLFIPCHRVIGADGSLTGYAGGLDVKQMLLDIESGRQVHGVL